MIVSCSISGNVVSVSGYGKIQADTWAQYTIISNLPVAIMTTRFFVSYQNSYVSGTFLCIDKDKTDLYLEAKLTNIDGWIFFGGCYIAKQ